MSHWKTSKTLMVRLKQQGDEQSWTRFSSTYRPYLIAIISKHGIAPDDADELTQDVMVRVWKSFDDFIYQPNRCKFRTWLGVIARNTALNYLSSKAKCQQRQQVDESSLLKIGTEAEVEQRTETEWQLFIAQKAWNALQADFSQAQLDCYASMLAGLSISETADKCGVKENSVYVYRKRVKERMRVEIQKLNAELDG